MPDFEVPVYWICGALLVVAFLYSSVGHAGASGYIAILTLFGMTDDRVKPIALTLNVLVASIGAIQFKRAGFFSWPLFWPLAVTSIPMAFLGGQWKLPPSDFHRLLGVVLWLSAARLLVQFRERERIQPPHGLALAGTGAGIGLLAGLTGTGGGVFLTPVMLFLGWAPTKTAAAVSVVFILVNSLAGLAGNLGSTAQLPPETWWFAGAALVGGSLGSYLGSRRFPSSMIIRILAVVLVIAGCKLVL